MCIFVLLGLTWVFGYFVTISGNSLVAHVIFIILNSLQGFFIFMFYVIGHREVRFGCNWSNNIFVKVPWRLSYSLKTPSSTKTSFSSEPAPVYRPSRPESESGFGIISDPSSRKTPDPVDDFYPLGPSASEKGTDPVSEAAAEDDPAASDDSGLDNECYPGLDSNRISGSGSVKELDYLGKSRFESEAGALGRANPAFDPWMEEPRPTIEDSAGETSFNEMK